MRLFVTILFAVVSMTSCSAQQQQQEVDPAYLRQYYAQIAQQAGAQVPQKATPIFEAQDQPQYQQQASPLRNVSSFFHPSLF